MTMDPHLSWNQDELAAFVAMIDATARSRYRSYFDTDRASELAILVCAYSVAHLHSDSRVANCLSVRLAWVRDEATPQDRNQALGAAEISCFCDLNLVTRSVARASTCYTGLPVQWAADYASRALAPSDDPVQLAEATALRARLVRALKHLFPDQTNLNVPFALGRFEEAVRIARG